MFARRFRNFHLRDLIECATFCHMKVRFSYKSATFFLRMSANIDNNFTAFREFVI